MVLIQLVKRKNLRRRDPSIVCAEILCLDYKIEYSAIKLQDQELGRMFRPDGSIWLPHFGVKRACWY